jgi:hypothetical protein
MFAPENMSAEEHANLETFPSHAKDYQHRLGLQLSKEEPFAPGLEARLKDSAFDFKRVAFPSVDMAFYLLNDMRAVKLMIDSALELCPELISRDVLH